MRSTRVGVEPMIERLSHHWFKIYRRLMSIRHDLDMALGG